MAKKELTTNILLIDDDPTFGLVMNQLAKDNDVELRHHTSWKKVDKNAVEDEFDAVIVDYDLEDMTGFEVAEALLELAPKLPVVMISATNRPVQDTLIVKNIVGFTGKWDEQENILDNILKIVQDNPQNDRKKVA